MQLVGSLVLLAFTSCGKAGAQGASTGTDRPTPTVDTAAVDRAIELLGSALRQVATTEIVTVGQAALQLSLAANQADSAMEEMLPPPAGVPARITLEVRGTAGRFSSAVRAESACLLSDAEKCGPVYRAMDDSLAALRETVPALQPYSTFTPLRVQDTLIP
jgi:hypothetical protein